MGLYLPGILHSTDYSISHVNNQRPRYFVPSQKILLSSSHLAQNLKLTLATVFGMQMSPAPKVEAILGCAEDPVEHAL